MASVEPTGGTDATNLTDSTDATAVASNADVGAVPVASTEAEKETVEGKFTLSFLPLFPLPFLLPSSHVPSFLFQNRSRDESRHSCCCGGDK